MKPLACKVAWITVLCAVCVLLTSAFSDAYTFTKIADKGSGVQELSSASAGPNNLITYQQTDTSYNQSIVLHDLQTSTTTNVATSCSDGSCDFSWIMHDISINGSGNMVFFGRKKLSETTEASGIYMADSSSTTAISTTTAQDYQYDYLPRINDNGIIAYGFAEMDGYDLVSDGLYMYQGGTGTEVVNSSTHIGSFDLNNNNELAYAGEDAAGNYCIFKYSGGSSTVLFQAATGGFDPATTGDEGGSNSPFNQVAYTDDGAVYFTADKANSVSGVYKYEDGALSTVVEGGGGTTTHWYNFAVSRNGEHLAYYRQVHDSDAAESSTGLYAADGSLILDDTTLIDGAEPYSFWMTPMAIANDGKLYLGVTLKDGDEEWGNNPGGIYRIDLTQGGDTGGDTGGDDDVDTGNVTIENASPAVPDAAEPAEFTFTDTITTRWVKFFGVEGETYTIVTTPASGSVSVELYDVDGETVLDTGLNIAWTCPADGVYYVKVAQSSRMARADGSFSISVTTASGAGGAGVVSGVITDASGGQPVADALVKLVGAVDRAGLSLADGSYVIMAPAGDYDFKVTAEGYQSFSADGLSLDGLGTETRNASLSAESSGEKAAWYYNRSEAGSGFSLQTLGDKMFLVWYAYDATGAAEWYLSTLTQQSGAFAGDIKRIEGWALSQGPSPLQPEIIGNVAWEFTPSGSAVLEWTIDGESGTESLTPLFLDMAPGDADSRGVNGWWWDPDKSGMGLFIEARGGKIFVGWYHYRDDGSPVWRAMGPDSFSDGQTTLTGQVKSFSGGQSIGGAWSQSTPVQDGAATLEFNSATSATFSFDGVDYELEPFPMATLR